MAKPNQNKPSPEEAPAAPRTEPLTEIEVKLLKEQVEGLTKLQEQMQAEMRGMLRMLLVQKKLKGGWKISDDLTHLIETPEPPKQ